MGLLGGFTGSLFGKKKPEKNKYAVQCTSYKIFSEDDLYIMPGTTTSVDRYSAPAYIATSTNNVGQVQTPSNKTEVVKMKKPLPKVDAKELFTTPEPDTKPNENKTENGTSNANIFVRQNVEKTKQDKEDQLKKKALYNEPARPIILENTKKSNSTKIDVNNTTNKNTDINNTEKLPLVSNINDNKIRESKKEITTGNGVQNGITENNTSNVTLQEEEPVELKRESQDIAPRSILKSKISTTENPQITQKETSVGFTDKVEEIPPIINYNSRPTSVEDYKSSELDFVNQETEVSDNVFVKSNNKGTARFKLDDKDEENGSEIFEKVPPKPKSRYSVADTFSSSAASIFFDDTEPEPEERHRKYLLNDSENEGSEASA